jgi:hypothetical protein
MAEIHAEIRATIWGTHDAWSLAQGSSTHEGPTETRVRLTLREGDGGYFLLQSPDGFFTADTWHATLADALDTAQRCFGVRPRDWHE